MAFCYEFYWGRQIVHHGICIDHHQWLGEAEASFLPGAKACLCAMVVPDDRPVLRVNGTGYALRSPGRSVASFGIWRSLQEVESSFFPHGRRQSLCVHAIKGCPQLRPSDLNPNNLPFPGRSKARRTSLPPCHAPLKKRDPIIREASFQISAGKMVLYIFIIYM